MKNGIGRSAVGGRVLAAMMAIGMTAMATVASAAEPRVVKLKGLDAMQYDVKVIQATPGEALKVTLTTVSSMAKAEMSHNFVLLAKGTNADAFAREAAMARDNGYIPKAKAASIRAQATRRQIVSLSWTRAQEIWRLVPMAGNIRRFWPANCPACWPPRPLRSTGKKC